MANIAADLAELSSGVSSGARHTWVRVLARGEGWWVDEVVCARGPGDKPFEEQHENVTVAIVTGGTFQYRGSGAGRNRELMTPGSLLLGNSGQYYECGHEHAAGDRCVSFHYTPACVESIAAGARRRPSANPFRLLRIPPVRPLSPLIVQVQAAHRGRSTASCPPCAPGSLWEELAVRIAAHAMWLEDGTMPARTPISAAALARVTEAVRLIEQRSNQPLTLADLARAANLSPFHFLRTFEDLTGVTPHQYLTRMRLHKVAKRLVLEPAKILDVALDSGFGDVSNFNHAFRAEFGVSPRAYRRLARP